MRLTFWRVWAVAVAVGLLFAAWNFGAARRASGQIVTRESVVVKPAREYRVGGERRRDPAVTRQITHMTHVTNSPDGKTIYVWDITGMPNARPGEGKPTLRYAESYNFDEFKERQRKAKK